MTRKEFEVYRLSLEKEKFPQHISDPIEYGIERTIFKKERLKKLIAVGKNIRSRTVQAKVERWKRQLDKLDHSQAHLVQLKKDLDLARFQVIPPVKRLPAMLPSRIVQPLASSNP